MGSVSHTVLCVIVVLVCLSAITDAQRERKNKKGKPCKYRKEKTKVCDPVENTRTLTMTLKKGADDCPPSKVFTLSCKKKPGCLYDGKTAIWNDCDPHFGRQAIVKSLAEGSADGCPTTHTRLKRCGRGKRRGGKRGRGKGRKKGNRRMRKNKKKQKPGRRGRGGRRNKMKVMNQPEQQQ